MMIIIKVMLWLLLMMKLLIFVVFLFYLGLFLFIVSTIYDSIATTATYILIIDWSVWLLRICLF